MSVTERLRDADIAGEIAQRRAIAFQTHTFGESFFVKVNVLSQTIGS